MSNISLSVVFTIHWTAHPLLLRPVSQCYHLPFLYFLTRSFESEDVVHKVSSRRGTVTCPASPNVLYRTASPPGLAPLTALCQPRDVTGWICPLFSRCVKTSQDPTRHLLLEAVRGIFLKILPSKSSTFQLSGPPPEAFSSLFWTS